MSKVWSSLGEWYEVRFEPAWWRSWSWRAALAGLVGAGGPDLVNLVLQQWSAIVALPVLSLQAKFWLCLAALAAVVVLRPLAQRNMPAQVVAVARFLVPRIVELATPVGGRVPVRAQVIPVEPHDPILDDPVDFADTRPVSPLRRPSVGPSWAEGERTAQGAIHD